jgi:hypothetical protein
MLSISTLFAMALLSLSGGGELGFGVTVKEPMKGRIEGVLGLPSLADKLQRRLRALIAKVLTPWQDAWVNVEAAPL